MMLPPQIKTLWESYVSMLWLHELKECSTDPALHSTLKCCRTPNGESKAQAIAAEPDVDFTVKYA